LIFADCGVITNGASIQIRGRFASKKSGVGRSINQQVGREVQNIGSGRAFEECGELSEALLTKDLEEG